MIFRNQKSKGFTLIEVVAAIGLLSVTAITIVSVYINANNAYRIGSDRSRLSGQGILAITRIEKDIRNILPYSTLNFEGNKQSFSMTSLLPIVENNKTMLIPTQIEYTRSENHPNLLYRLVSTPGSSNLDSTLVCDNIDSLYFNFNIYSEDGSIQIEEEWISSIENPLPIAIDIKMILCNHDTKDENTMEFGRTVFLPLGECVNEENSNP